MEPVPSNITINKSARLFDEFKKGDDKAFEELFLRMFPRLVDFASKITRNETIAEDILQDVFIKLWTRRNKIENINIEAYIFRLVRNECLDYFRHIKIISEKEIEFNRESKYEELYRIDFLGDEPYLLITDELKNEIQNTIDSLPERCREVFILSRIEGLKNMEIAEKLKINVKNVERHLSRAMTTFRERFSGRVPFIIVLSALCHFFS